eukprot:589036-Hanusia_phi.AAC.4
MIRLRQNEQGSDKGREQAGGASSGSKQREQAAAEQIGGWAGKRWQCGEGRYVALRSDRAVDAGEAARSRRR